MLVFHICGLSQDTLAGKIYDEQVSNKWPGLAQEAEDICSELGVESVRKTTKSKKVYRNLLVKACHVINQDIIKRQSEGKSKCERMSREEYGKKQYVKNEQIGRVRDTYKARFGMSTFAGNFTNDKRFAKTEGLCRCKRVREE